MFENARFCWYTDTYHIRIYSSKYNERVELFRGVRIMNWQYLQIYVYGLQPTVVWHHFPIFLWCKNNKHLLETLLWILILSLISHMYYNPVLIHWVVDPTADPSQPCGPEGWAKEVPGLLNSEIQQMRYIQNISNLYGFNEK